MTYFNIFNKKLETKLDDDRRRIHYEKNQSIDNLWQVEKQDLNALP